MEGLIKTLNNRGYRTGISDGLTEVEI